MTKKSEAVTGRGINLDVSKLSLGVTVELFGHVTLVSCFINNFKK